MCTVLVVLPFCAVNLVIERCRKRWDVDEDPNDGVDEASTAFVWIGRCLLVFVGLYIHT